MDQLTIKARAEINGFLANGVKVAEGKRVISLVPDYVMDPTSPSRPWHAVKLNTQAHGGRIEFVVDEAALEKDPLLSNIKQGESYRIVIPTEGNQ